MLSRKQALEYLKYSAGVVVEQAMDNGYELDYENASEILKDLMCMGVGDSTRRLRVGENYAPRHERKRNSY